MIDPAAQFWVVRGDIVLHALERAREGEDPGLIYLELLANSESDTPE